MNLKQLISGLKKAFDDGDTQNRIVFWQDEGKAFVQTVGQLPFADLAGGGVTLLRLDECGAFEAKLKMERDEKESRFLVYSPFPIPTHEEDWLLDVRLYSRPFNADRASMVMAELGLEHMALKEHIAQRLGFFDATPAHEAQKRLNALKTLVSPFDSAADLDMKMMAVLAGTKTPDLEHVVIALLHRAVASSGKGAKSVEHVLVSGEGAATDAPQLGLGLTGDPVAHILRFGLDTVFWSAVGERYGFSDPEPTLEKLVKRLMITEFARTLQGADVPAALAPLQLPKGAQTANVQYCLAVWRDSMGQHASFDKWSRRVARSLELKQVIGPMSRAHVDEVPTFLDCEKLVLARLRDELMNAVDPQEAFELADFHSAVAKRKSSYWVREEIPDGPKVARSMYMASYRALEAASELVDLRRQFPDGFQYESAEKLWASYVAKLYRFDSAYRLVHEAADQVKQAGTDFLKPLLTAIEELYCNWYLTSLADAWMPFVEKSAGAGQPSLMESWTLSEVPRQVHFYERFVAPPLSGEAGPKKKRVFVIISDALRFEVAQEVTSQLSKTYRYQATLDSMMGVVPSYTGLGMAALLPHKSLSYDDKGGVRADGKTTAGLENRGKILKEVNGMAFDVDELRKLSQKDARKAVNGYEVVYLYERGIDAVADKGATEDQTFIVARQTIDKLQRLVQWVVNTLNGSHVIVTSDHGFLYQETKPTEVDKSKLGEKPAKAYKTKKRYVIGKDLADSAGAVRGKVSTTAGVEGDVDFLVPRGTQLFHFTGGARFVHGGVMPQEVVVPVVTVNELEGKKAAQQRPEPVEIQLLGSNHRFVMNRQRFTLLQMRPVGETDLPAKVSIGVYEGSELVSNKEELVFTSTSDNLEERKREVWLAVKGDDLSKKECRIEIRDLDTLKVKSIPVTIDIAFGAVDF